MKYTLWFILFLFIVSACSDKVDIEDSQAETFNKLYGNSGNDRGCEIKELPNGDFLILATVQTANKSSEIVLIRTDRFGNEQWTKPLGDSVEAEAGGMDFDANGNIIVVGTAFNPGTTEEDSNHTDIIVIELGASGDIIQERVFSQFLDNEEGNDILYDKSIVGGYILGGSTDKSDTIGIRTANRNPTANNKFTKDIFTIRVFQVDGNEVLEDFNAGFQGNDVIQSCIPSGDEFDNFLLTGTTVDNGVSKPFILSIRNENDGYPINDFREIDLGSSGTGTKIITINSGFAIMGTSRNNSAFFIQEFKMNKSFKGNPLEFQKTGVIEINDFIFDQNLNRYLVAGTTNTEGLADGGGFDHYIAAISADSADGNSIKWEKTYGGTGDEVAFAIAPTSDGGYIITGYTGFEGNSLINTIKVDNKGILNP